MSKVNKFRIPVASAMFSLVTLIGLGTWVFRLLEDWTWIQSFYFTVSTLTTVGYGDVIYLTNDESRLFASFFILAGVGIVLAALTSIGTRYLRMQEHQLSDNITRRLNNHQHDDSTPKQKKH